MRLFQIEQLSKAGPVADRDLLDFINGQYLRELDPGQFYEALDALLARIEAQGEGVVIEEGTKQGRVAHELSAEEVSRFAAAFRRDPDYSRRVLTLERSGSRSWAISSSNMPSSCPTCTRRPRRKPWPSDGQRRGDRCHAPDLPPAVRLRRWP